METSIIYLFGISMCGCLVFLCCFIVLAYEKEGLEMVALSACCILLVISYIATEPQRLARHVFLFVTVHRVISYQIRSAALDD